MDDDRARGYHPINGRGWDARGWACGIDHTMKREEEANDVRQSEMHAMPEQEAVFEEDNAVDFRNEKRVEFAPIEYVDRTCARYDMLADDEANKITQRVSYMESSMEEAQQEHANSVATMQDVIDNFVSKFAEDMEKQARMSKKNADDVLVVSGIMIVVLLMMLYLVIRMQ